MKPMSFRSFCNRVRRDEHGSIAMEFVIVFPLLMFFFMMVFETGFIATRSVLLERGLDIAARGLRLGTDPTIDHEKLKKLEHFPFKRGHTQHG